MAKEPPAGAKTGAKNPNLGTAARPTPSLDALLEGLRTFDRTRIGQALSLVESGRPEDRPQATDLLVRCQEQAVNAMRIAVSGAPGVGKSTLIDALGVHLLEQGHRVAVLAVDPTSNRTGGSILGDKTRMPRLAASASAFIRPSPTSGNLGGVSRHTRAAISVCEAAGCDVILVETVGVGQSETAVRDMVDYFLLLALAGAGDELQGIKRGIIEVADAIAVTKADGDNLDRAKNAAARIRSSLRLFPAEESGWQPRTHTCSALEDRGIGEIWDAVLKYRDLTSENGFLRRRRRSQRVHWFDEEVLALQLAASRAGAHELRQEFCTRVSQGELHPSVAADEYCAQA